MTEEWRPAIGFEELYEVSDKGRVRSLPRVVLGRWGSSRLRMGQMLALPKNRDGYPQVTFSIKNKRTSHPVHRLVCNAFLGLRPNDLVVRHLDGDPANNNLSNLIYGTYSENEADKDRHGRRPAHNAANAKLTRIEAAVIKQSTERTSVLARAYGVKDATICDIRHGRTWRHL